MTMPRVKDPVVQDGIRDDDVLHRVADAVPIHEIGSVRVKEIIARMNAVLDREPDGVAIAAPQIGSPLRIFVVKNEVFEGSSKKNVVFINPVITKRSRTTDWMDEGCLSVRNWFGKVKRSDKATVRAYNEQGVFFERGGSGLLAQIFQHEVDHLNGTLFTEKAVELIEYEAPKKDRETSKRP